MRRSVRVFLLGFLCAGAIFGAFSHHVVLTSDGLVVERKTRLGLDGTFADTRNWGPFDYLAHPEIAKALLRHGLGRLAKGGDSALDRAREQADEALDRAKKGLGKVEDEGR